MKKRIILSYDYELFFGVASGTVEKSIIVPTNYILEDLEKYKLVGSFFIDWQMLKYLKLANTEDSLSDLNLIENQIKDIVKRGHRVELHIHPHWVNAKYNEDGTWDFSDFHHYSLNSFQHEVIVEMFVEGKDLINNIAREVDPNYNICAFRAGGWAVQPFSVLKDAFRQAGILIDSSCAYGTYYKSDYSYYDFRADFLEECNYYRFSNDVLKPENNGEFIEVPITSYKRTIVQMIADKVCRLFTKKLFPITDGTHARPDLPSIKHSYKLITRDLVTMSKRSPFTVLSAVLFNPKDIIVLIDHPKDYSLSNHTSFRLLAKFVKPLSFYQLYKEIAS